MADRWSERVRTLTGEVSCVIPNTLSDKCLTHEKSAEVVVVKTASENLKERRTEQFYRYKHLYWRSPKTTGQESAKVDSDLTRTEKE